MLLVGYQGRSEFGSGEATSGNLFVFHGSENYLSSSISNLHAYASVETDRKQIQSSTKKTRTEIFRVQITMLKYSTY